METVGYVVVFIASKSVFRSYGSNIVYTDWQRDNYFVAVKEALGNIQGRIGVEFDHLSLDNHKWV